MGLKAQVPKLDDIIARASAARMIILRIQTMQDEDTGVNKTVLLDVGDPDSALDPTNGQVATLKARAWNAIGDVKTKAASLPDGP